MLLKKGFFLNYFWTFLVAEGGCIIEKRMSYTCGDDNSDVVDQSAVKSRVPGVLGINL